MSFRRMTAAAATGALLLSSSATAQDSATVDVEATLVESPATFSITGLSPLSFGQISLPRYNPDTQPFCIYSITNVLGDGSANLEFMDANNAQEIYVGTIGMATKNGCYAIGDVQPAQFQFSCDSVDVTFSVSKTETSARPEWDFAFSEAKTNPAVSRIAIGKDGITVASGSDVANPADPWGINCLTEGAGDYDLFVGGSLNIFATADTSTAVLGPQTLGTITVDAIY